MTTSLKKGKYAYFCGQCGQNCEVQNCEPTIQKDQCILEQLHHQNNSLIEQIKYLSKRNDELNQVIDSRLRTQERSLNKDMNRSRNHSGLIYRRINYEVKEAKETSPQYQQKPTNTTTIASLPKKVNNNDRIEAYKIIKTSHLTPDKELQQRKREITPLRKSIFSFEQESTQRNSINKVKGSRYEQYYDRTASKTPTKQLNYLPIYEYKRQYKQPEATFKESYKPAPPPSHYEVTFRNETQQNRRVGNPLVGHRVEKRTNEPYLAMLDQSKVNPSVYYPSQPTPELGFYFDKVQPDPYLAYHKRLYSEY